MFEFGKQMKFDEKASGKNNTRDKIFVNLLKTPAIMAGSLRKKSLSKLEGNKRDFIFQSQ